MVIEIVIVPDGTLAATGAEILGLRKSEPTLEDVFVELVGRGFEESEAEPPVTVEIG